MTFIARGITVKGITVKAPLARGIQVAGGFTPEFLFLDGQQGVWYEPKPVIDGQQILYQDSAATTPVTSDGDPVGYMRDLSGNGNHATQATSAARPLYRRYKINQLVNTDTLSTQSVTVEAVPYILSFEGGGSVTLSGAHSDTLSGSTGRVSLEFTPSAGELTLTVSGEVLKAQLEKV